MVKNTTAGKYRHSMQSNRHLAPDYALPDLRGASATDIVPSLTRPISSYPAMPDTVVNHLRSIDPGEHIYTKSLNKGGLAVQDEMETYLSRSEYLSSGTILSILDTPLHFHYEYVSGWKEKLEKYKEEKKHFRLGTFLHQAILEPSKFRRVIAEPDKYKGASINRGWKAHLNFLIVWWSALLVDRGIVNADDLTAIKDKHDTTSRDGAKAAYEELKKISGIRAIPKREYDIVEIAETYHRTYGGGILPRLLKHSKREISLYLVDPDTGLKLRVRFDAMQFKENIGVDALISLKTTRHQRIDRYFYDACQRDYLMKDAMYLDVARKVTGRDFSTVINIVYQTCEPYAVMVMYYTPEDIEKGMYRYRSALISIQQAMEKDHFPGYDSFAERGNMGIIEFQSPGWYGKELSPVNLEG